MERLEWNKILDKYLTEGTMSPDDYERMSDEYKYVIQELKKSFKRIKNKEYDTEFYNSSER